MKISFNFKNYTSGQISACMHKYWLALQKNVENTLVLYAKYMLKNKSFVRITTDKMENWNGRKTPDIFFMWS
jgi:hypothetical protein